MIPEKTMARTANPRRLSRASDRWVTVGAAEGRPLLWARMGINDNGLSYASILRDGSLDDRRFAVI